MAERDSTRSLSSPSARSFEVPAIVAGTLVGGRYEISAVLGAGGYAVVYLARDRELARDVALKVLRAERLQPAALVRFRREAAVARDVSHPRLLRIFDFGTAPEGVFLSMEILPGGTLAERLRSGPLPISAAVSLTQDALEALVALHTAGVVHRDIKPSNLLLDAEGHLKLADFGLALRLGGDETRATVSEGVLGTIAYLSPEQALGHEATARSDLYSLGVVLFEMLAGKLPHASRSDFGTLMAHVQRRAPSVRDLRGDTPRWLTAVVARLLEKRPGDRYPDAAFALADVRRRRAPRWLSPARRRGAVAIALVATLASALGWAIAGRQTIERIRILPLEPQGIQALDGQGRHLWALPNVDSDASRSLVFARLEAGAKPRLVGVLSPPGGSLPAETRVLSILDPATGAVLRRLPLPDRPQRFASLSDHYHAREAIRAIDLDGDGVDEILISFAHAEAAPDYTVLYEPRLDRVRTVFYGWGNQDIAGAQDVDGDGKPELLISGINNAFGWYNVVAAVRLTPPVGVDGAVSVAVSPDSAEYPAELHDLAWYTLLPRGALSGLAERVQVDGLRRRLTIGFDGAPPVAVGFDGFLVDEPSTLSPATRAAFRERAFASAFEARRLQAAGFADQGVRQAEGAVQAARAAEESRLVECMQRVLARVSIAAGRVGEGKRLFEDLVARSENASDITFDAGRAFHLRGDLEEALRWYERGLGPGGTVSAGKSKWEFLEGGVLALGERARWQEAVAWVERFRATYPGSANWAAFYPEYVHWRSGQVPNLGAVRDGPSVVAQLRYWKLEFRLANGEADQPLLLAVESEAKEPSEMHGELLSLQSVLLDRLGRHAEALQLARDGFEEVRRSLPTSVLSRAHLDLAAQRLARLSGTDEDAAALAAVDQLRRRGASAAAAPHRASPRTPEP